MRDGSFDEIETRRLRLRRFRARDVGPFAAYRANSDVVRFQSWGWYTLERAERFVEEMSRHDPGVAGEPFQFAVARRGDDALIGDCMLAIGAGEAPLAEIGYTLAPAHQGRGYATEAVVAVVAYAFECHGVSAVRAVTDARNMPSLAVAERVGMALIGSVRTTFNDEPCEEHTYELTREQWEARGA